MENMHAAFYEIQNLWLGISLFILIGFLLNQTKLFREFLSYPVLTLRKKVIFIVTFSLMGIAGTYWNIPVPAGIINFRSMGVLLGGFLGGPVVGAVSGFVVGACRVILFFGPENELHGVLSLMQGLLAGFLSSYVLSRKRIWLAGFLASLGLELLGMAALFAVSWPRISPENILHLAVPIVLTNSIAVGFFIGILENTLRQQSRIEQETAAHTFEIVKALMKMFPSGFTAETLQKINTIIVRILPHISFCIVEGGIDAEKSFVFQDSVSPEMRKLIQKDFQNEKIREEFHFYSVSITDEKMSQQVQIIAAKPQRVPFQPLEIKFLEGTRDIVLTLIRYDRLRKESGMLTEARIRMLQAQINPHFLFNIINTISYYCMSDPEMASDLLGDLSDYYRHNLSNPSSFIPLSEELDTIRSFIRLQQARFGDRLKVNFHFQGFDSFLIPPLLLQPLVENAILHGVLPRQEGGIVTAGVIHHDEYDKFYVCDNGTGMDKERLSHLLDDAVQRKRIGMVNVEERLNSIYGPESRLKITSRKGKGTIVSFKIYHRKGNKNGTDNPGTYSR